MRRLLPLLAVTCFAACSNTDAPPARSDVDILRDGGLRCTPDDDWDGDGIPNGEEGCLDDTDSDGDGTPDWQDFDSDGDGIPDSVEAGKKGACLGGAEVWPCDTDGDGQPDYLDIDSDGDGLLDKDEDTNGDGILGCCLVACGEPRGAQKPNSQGKGGCLLNAVGCGGSQTCVDGKCTPPIDVSCSNGETDPRQKDTFKDGKIDNTRGVFVCRDGSENRPGRKAVREFRSADPTKDTKSGDWHVALEPNAKYGDITIQSPKDKEAASAIDYDQSDEFVAGFIISMPATVGASLQDELSSAIADLHARPPGGQTQLSVRASGIEGRSHDDYQTVRGTTLDLRGGHMDVSTARNEIIAAILDRPPANFSNLPRPFGRAGSMLTVRLVTIRRFAFLKDKKGALVLGDDGRPQEDPTRPQDQRVIIMGAVALHSDYQNPNRKTGFLVDDLSNGTAIARWSDELEVECDVQTISRLPVADIIWVIDESGSMAGERQNVVANAGKLYSRALVAGLDFRMAVTGVSRPDQPKVVGKFCSRAALTRDDDGGTDRFLLPNEQALFDACVRNPPGHEHGFEYGLVNAREALYRHLPRANAPNKIRPEAQIVVIVATDEVPQSFSEFLAGSEHECQLEGATQTKLQAAITPYLRIFKGEVDPDTKTIFHVLGGVCNGGCGADVAHGYRELAQQLDGQVGDICQSDLGYTLQSIINSIVGAVSPVVLEHEPVASSLAVALDGVALKRSRTKGFEYRAEKNSLAFIDVKLKKGIEVVASYRRWVRKQVLR